LHDATIDPEVSRRWFQDHPTDNFGLTTGVSIDVIDLHGGAAIAALEASKGRRERLQGAVVRKGLSLHVLATRLRNRAGKINATCPT
jgi:hypothetical protein